MGEDRGSIQPDTPLHGWKHNDASACDLQYAFSPSIQIEFSNKKQHENAKHRNEVDLDDREYILCINSLTMFV